MTTGTMISLTDITDQPTIDAISSGLHTNPFAVLGPHRLDGSGNERWVVRTYQPHAESVSLLLNRQSHEMASSGSGIFACVLEKKPDHYTLRLRSGDHQWDSGDPYRYSSSIGELDHHLFSAGDHQALYELMGANRITQDKQEGVRFVVWAPNASIVSVIGDFNDWDQRRNILRKHPQNGLWEIFIPDLQNWSSYKYYLRDNNGTELPLKSDPFARYCEAPPGNASITHTSGYQWQDQQWQSKRVQNPDLSQPMSIYEVHAGSWRWKDGRSMTYTELTDTLIPYVLDRGFTHLEFLPLSEHPFTGSWGYQPTGLYAPTQRFGDPDDFRYFVDQCHQRGLGVIMDWVPAHFPGDDHGLALFDGTHLYEHADPRQGKHNDWDTLIYNYGRNEVANFLSANALFWIREFHLDGLRMDAVASMLYLDYSREDGEWIPNEHGGNINLDAARLLQRINEQIHAEKAFTLAEESTSYDGVTRPVFSGGLGFTYKWNMGWMHDILDYLSADPVYRKHHHKLLTFGMMYSYTENFALPFSHDEVVYGKGSMLGKMAGDPWQARANLRCCYAFMYAYPGKKLLFMGSEFGQLREWSHDRELDWFLFDDPDHLGLFNLIGDLNATYKRSPALYERDFDPEGFQWIDCDDEDQSVISWYRHADDQSIIVICNMTPVVRHGYRIGCNTTGEYRVLLNTDDHNFGGSGISSGATWHSESTPCHGREHSLVIDIPPLSALYLTCD